MERIPFKEEYNQISFEEGKRIYLELRKKFPTNSLKDLDIILNSLCFSLLCLQLKSHSYNEFNKLVMSILEKNTKQPN